MKPALPVTSAAVEASTTMETASAVKASTEARLPARGEPSGGSPVVKATERTGMGSRWGIGWCEPMLRSGPVERRTSTWPSARTPALKSTSAMKSAGVIEVVAIDEDSTVGLVGVVVVDNTSVTPVGIPVVPAPAKAAEIADSEAEAKSNSRSGKIESWIRIPAWPDSDRLSIHEPGIIFRHVNDLRIGRLDHNCLSLLGHVLLRCAA